MKNKKRTVKVELTVEEIAAIALYLEDAIRDAENSGTPTEEMGYWHEVNIVQDKMYKLAKKHLGNGF